VDLQTDSHHCGECFQGCEYNFACVEGGCLLRCPDGYERCGDDCVNTMTNSGHCGECGNACANYLVCVSGVCACEDPIRVDCEDACIDASSDPANCGGCHNVCAPFLECIDSECRCAGDTELACNGACVDVTEDRNNCGECGLQCPPDQTCTGAECRCDLAGHIVCDGLCVDSWADEANCGECNNVCDEGVECNFGWCGAVREEHEPNNSADACNPIAVVDWTVSGEVNGDHDFFCFAANEGESITFDIDARNGVDPPPRSSLDSYLILHSTDPVGELARNDDSDGLDSRIDFQFRESGIYAIEVCSCCPGDGGPGATYNLHITSF